MGLFTKRQFAELCGKNQKYIQSYLSRGKIFARKDGYMDDQVPANADFIRKMRAKMNVNSEKPAEKTNLNRPVDKAKETNHQTSTLPSPNKPENFATQTVEPTQLEMFEAKIESKTKELNFKLLEERLQIERLKKEKLEGKVIPTELVKSLFSNTFKAFTNRFYQSAEDISQIMINQLGGNREDMIEFSKKLIKSINTTVVDSQDDARNMLINIIKEYSQRKDVGERE